MSDFNNGDYVMVRHQQYGYLMSPGFTDDRVFDQEVKDFNLVPNVRDMLFQLLPKLKYYHTYEHRKFMRQHPGTLNEYEAQELSSLTKAKDDEDEENKQTIRRGFKQLWSNHKYFQLLHFKSQVMLRTNRMELITNESGDEECYIKMRNGKLKMYIYKIRCGDVVDQSEYSSFRYSTALGGKIVEESN
jgi:hypothetical protein